MAYEIPGFKLTLPVKTNTAVSKYTFLTVDSDGKCLPVSASGSAAIVGVAQDSCTQAQATAGYNMEIMVTGVTKLVSGGTIDEGACVVSSATGTAQAAGSSASAAGIVLKGGAATEYLTVLLHRTVAPA